ncbi:MAG: hypothetical protein NXI32_05465 [bacterium]|nr:hypothetical protein [bacterium]
MTDKAFDAPLWLSADDRELFTDWIILHEIGHNWDTQSENITAGSFRRISGWTQSGDDWVPSDTSEFSTVHSRRDPLEDFAEHFAMYFMQDDYLWADPSNSPRKMNHMNYFANNINTIYVMSNI